MTDFAIIKKIEKELKTKLEKIDVIKRDSIGYTLNKNGQISDLFLKDCEIKHLNLIISPLKGLTSLTRLDLSNNQLRDISLLKELTGLKQLNLYSNQISDISPLKELKSLTKLLLSYNPISDISPLKELTGLIELTLHDNQIIDISPLNELTSLTRLAFTSQPPILEAGNIE